MNWLAHLQLAPEEPAWRIGSLLPDLVDTRTLQDLPEVFLPGIREHRLVDAFTDRHPLFLRSRSRIGPPFRRFSGILVDVYYDHLLANDWNRHSPQPLRAFLDDFYAAVEQHRHLLPEVALSRLTQMCEGDWMGTYLSREGIRDVLIRIGGRFKRPVDLAPSVDLLFQQHESLTADFREFYPELTTHVEGVRHAGDA